MVWYIDITATVFAAQAASQHLKFALNASRFFAYRGRLRRYKYSMAQRKKQQSWDSSRSSIRSNGNYTVNISLDHNKRGRVEIRQDHDTTEWSNKSIIQYTTPNLRQTSSD